jgi:hypothetical protein
MQEKNACERVFFHLANHTSVLLAPRRCAADPASRFLVRAAPPSHACPHFGLAAPRGPTGCCFPVQHWRCLSPRLW